MIKKILSLLTISLIFINISVHAQFPYTNSYRNHDAPNTKTGGSDEAFLTAGRGRIAGPGNTSFEDVEGQGYLRLTNNGTFQKGYIYNTTSFPSNNGLKIEFEYYTYGGTGADGICFFLFDAKAGDMNDPAEIQRGVTEPFQIGSFGGSLGYSQISIPQGQTGGVSKGYLGVGIDEYGNFATATEGRQGGVNALQPGSVTLRGKGDGANFFDPENYKYLTHVRTQDAPFNFDLIPAGNDTRYPEITSPNYRKLSLDLKPRTDGIGYDLTVRITRGGISPVTTTIIDNYPYAVAAPQFLRYGLAGSTGSNTNFHEIRNVRVDEYFSNTPVAANITSTACPGLPVSTNVAAQALPTQIIDINSVDLQPTVNGIQRTLVISGKGTATVNADGVVTFTPLNGTVVGEVNIPYTVTSNSGILSNVATLKINVLPELVVLAGDDQTINVGASGTTTIQLNGNALATGLTGAWTQIAGPNVAITNAATSTASIIGARAGNYTFRWTVTSAGSCQKSDDVNIVVQEIPIPKIGVTKTVAQSVQTANGSFNITYDFNITNYGDVRLNDVSLIDDLASVFSGTTFSVTSKAIIGVSNLEVNSNYNGTSDKELLSPNSFLEIGRSGQVRLQINVLPVPTDGTFLNTATASGKSSFNAEVATKISSNSVTPGPDLPASPTPVTLTIPKPKIGLTKVLTSSVQNANGSYNIKYLFTVSNFGDIKLKNISLIDDLAAVFSQTTVTVVSKAIVGSSSLIINNNFNAAANKDLLDAQSTLDVGQSGQVELEINVLPVPRTGVFLNTATAYGASTLTNEQVSKVSSNSVTPGPDLPASETPVTLTVPQPKIGHTKIGVNKTLQPNGSYNVDFLFTVTNFGDVRLNNVSITDDLESVFAGTQFRVVSIAKEGTSTLQVNNGYNGVSNKELLDQSSYLELNGEGKILLKLNILPTEKEGTFLNTSLAKGKSAITNAETSKVSSNSISSAPDQDPSPTPVPLEKTPIFIPNGFSPNNDGINDKFVIKNAGNRKASLEVYNRWSNRIYRSANYDNSWDGRCTEGIHVGTDVPPGTYYYIVKLDDKDKYTGYITINR